MRNTLLLFLLCLAGGASAQRIPLGALGTYGAPDGHIPVVVGGELRLVPDTAGLAEETDPTVPEIAKAITAADTTRWGVDRFEADTQLDAATVRQYARPELADSAEAIRADFPTFEDTDTQRSDAEITALIDDRVTGRDIQPTGGGGYFVRRIFDNPIADADLREGQTWIFRKGFARPTDVYAAFQVDDILADSLGAIRTFVAAGDASDREFATTGDASVRGEFQAADLAVRQSFAAADAQVRQDFTAADAAINTRIDNLYSVCYEDDAAAGGAGVDTGEAYLLCPDNPYGLSGLRQRQAP